MKAKDTENSILLIDFVFPTGLYILWILLQQIQIFPTRCLNVEWKLNMILLHAWENAQDCAVISRDYHNNHVNLVLKSFIGIPSTIFCKC